MHFFFRNSVCQSGCLPAWSPTVWITAKAGFHFISFPKLIFIIKCPERWRKGQVSWCVEFEHFFTKCILITWNILLISLPIGILKLLHLKYAVNYSSHHQAEHVLLEISVNQTIDVYDAAKWHNPSCNNFASVLIFQRWGVFFFLNLRLHLKDK